jgi:ElaB/YqjD/DUF883 family membrane-anchored ribosome-binding protein
MHSTTDKLSNAADSAANAFKDVRGQVEKNLGPVLDQATQAAGAAVQKTQDAVAVASERGMKAASQAAVKAGDAREVLETTVRANPVLWVGLALAAGWIVGAAWNSSKR